mgnify:CR=1 FL=1
MKTLNINIKTKGFDNKIFDVMKKYNFKGDVKVGQYNLYYLIGEITVNEPISEIAFTIGRDLLNNNIDYMTIKPTIKYELY